jgi:hypothetical protein
LYYLLTRARAARRHFAAFFYGLEAVSALGGWGVIRFTSTKTADQERQSNSNTEVV